MKNRLNKSLSRLKKEKLVFICSENADLDKSEFGVVKDFRVGKNCIVNDHHLIVDIKKWMDDNNVEDHVFLFSASSLSEVLIYELYKHNDKNTYIDVGTTLHPYLGLSIERDYLRAYHGNMSHPDLFKSCV